MSLVVISENGKKSYQIRSTDIVNGAVDNATWKGADVYATDTQKWYRVQDDLTIKELVQPPFAASRSTLSVIMESGSGVSGSIAFGNYDVSTICPPSDWVTNNISFKVTYGDGVWRKLNDKSSFTEYTITSASAGGAYPLSFDNFYGATGLKVVSGTNGSPIVQSGSRIISLPSRII